MQIGFLDEDGLRVAGDAPREGIGDAKRRAERQHRDRIGAADSSGKGGDGAAHDVPMRIALGHHAPGGLRGDAGPRSLKPARLFDARPKVPDCPKLGDGQELVLVGGKAEEDEAARILEGHAMSLERAEISDGIGKREGKLLRFRSSGRVDWSPSPTQKGPVKPCDTRFEMRPVTSGASSLQGLCATPRVAMAPNGSKPKRMLTEPGANPLAFT